MSRQYFITDGTKFAKQDVSSNKYSFTSSMSLADTWGIAKVAEAIINNSIPLPLRNKCYVAYCDGTEIVPYTLSINEKKERRDRVSANTDNKTYELKQYSFNEDEGLKMLIDSMEKAKSALMYSQEQYRKLEERLVYLDLVDEDLKHYLGRCKVNARDGYKLTSIRQRVVIERISIKNQLDIVKAIKNQYNIICEPINNICKTIEELRNQKYKPRVLVDLFENGTVDKVVV